MTNRSEKARVGLRGFWRDTLEDPEGRIVHDSGWQSNQIQDSAYLLTASALRRYSETALGEGYHAISYLAVGSGENSWDVTPPEIDTDATTLVNEVYRKPLSGSLMPFHDGEGVTEDEVPAFMATVVFGPDEANGNLREFGLVGGHATDEAETGLLFNFVSHPIIEKSPGFTLTRRIRIEVQAP